MERAEALAALASTARPCLIRRSRMRSVRCPRSSLTMYDMVLLKTDFKHLRGVREHSKHATDGVLTELRSDGTLLIQVTALSSRTAAPMVEYAMTYVGCYRDHKGESKAIWGHQWEYIIQGYGIYPVRRPFDIRRVKVSSKNYGQGAIRFAYVVPEDAKAIREGGWLEPRPTFTDRP